jgi:hypothetical protein
MLINRMPVPVIAEEHALSAVRMGTGSEQSESAEKQSGEEEFFHKRVWPV